MTSPIERERNSLDGRVLCLERRAPTPFRRPAISCASSHSDLDAARSGRFVSRFLQIIVLRSREWEVGTSKKG